MLKVKNSKQCLEKKYNNNSAIIEIGIDEAGRGPMFGRVYSAAVVLPNDHEFKYELLKDSKKFTSETKIMEVADYIQKNALYWAVSYEDEKVIDAINIRQATLSAMHKALRQILNAYYAKNNMICSNELCYLLVDGNDFKPYTYYCETSNIIKQLNHILIEGGDNKYCSIAAASILAKVERDKYIRELCNNFPKLNIYYGLLTNKGYGTSKHIEAIKNYGISKWHRTTYGCCKYASINDSEDFYKDVTTIDQLE
jgi:ribonuclease HII